MKNVEVEKRQGDMKKLPEAAAFPEKEVSDEFCPDDVYSEVENIGKTAFRCHQCSILFLPESYQDGHIIANHEECRKHIGVLKCEHCAIVMVGLAKIGCHRQVCHYSA